MKPPPGHRLRAPEAAQRFFEAWQLHRSVLTVDELLAGRWMVVQLADGRSDNTAYETYEAAVHSARNNPSRCAYPRILLEAQSLEWCDWLLWYVRACYDSGHRADPSRQLIMPTRVEALRAVPVRSFNWRR